MARGKGQVMTSVEMPVTLRHAVEGIAARDGVRLSETIRRLLAAGVVRELLKARE
jgi:hypothetical protein